MAKKLQTNSFEKGMNKSLSKDRLPNNAYRNARNFRLSDDMEDSGGALVNVKGNALDFVIPTSPSVFKVIPIQGASAPLAGIIDTFVVITASGTISLNINLESGGFEDYFNQIVDIANDTSSSLYLSGVKVLRTSPKSIAVYSEISDIIEVNSSGQSNYTVGYKFAERRSGLEIIGWCELRDSLILFTTDDATDDGGAGQIWYAKYDKVSDTYSLEIRYTNDSIGFTKKHPIQAVARYENDNTQRVYWTNNKHNVKSLNVATKEVSMGIDSSFLNLNPSVVFSRPVLKSINTGGTLKAGIYQYAYRLSSSTGAQTKVSPASKMINVLVNSESGTEWNQISNEYNGSNPGTPTTKSVTITIDGIDTSYDTIEFIYLYYGSAVGTPEIFIFESTEIPTTGSITITHTGQEQESSMTETEYKSFGIPFDTAKTITYKDNRLLVANVKSDKNKDLTFHARAYRFGNQNSDHDVNGNATPYNSGNSYPLVNGPSNIKSYVPGLDILDADWGYPDPEDSSVSAEVRNAINPYNKADWDLKHLPFKWQTDGITLGGEGPYVKYKFTTLDKVPGGSLFGYKTVSNSNIINDRSPLMESIKSTTIYDFNTNSETYEVQTSPLNHKSPYINNNVVGYMNGEVYRFGIVLYDLAGNAGFVNWIGDIKFPERWEMRANMNAFGNTPTGEVSPPSYSYVTGADMNSFQPIDNYSIMNQLGIEFDITLPTEILNRISGYEIVRVKRETSDRTKIAQGVGNLLAQVKSDSNLYLFPFSGANDYDWDVDGLTSKASGLNYQNNETFSSYPNGAKRSLVFYSPEMQFFNNIGFSVGDRIRVEGAFDMHLEKDVNTNLTVYRAAYSRINFNFIHPSVSATYGDPLDSNRVRGNSKTTIPVNFAREVNPGEQVSLIPGIGAKFINATIPDTDTTGSEVSVNGANCLYMAIDADLYLPYLSAGYSGINDAGIGFTNGFLLITYERELVDQYGGNTQAARANNTYIKTGGFIKVDSGSLSNTKFKVFGGDVYHAEYDLTRKDKNVVLVDPVNNTSRDGFVMPIQSTFNITLRKGRHLLNKAESDGSYPATSVTTQTHDTFEIENLYSREDDYVLFIGRQIDVDLIDVFDNRIYASKSKINGETIDNWRQFETFLYKDVDGSHGPINNLVNHNDNIYYFQDRACGYLLVNPRAQVSSGGAGSLQVGFGDVLHDFEYISTEVGCFHQWATVSTNTNLFFLDVYNKQMYAIRGKQLLPTSLQGGMNPWFFENFKGNILNRDNPLLKQGITCTWDRRFNEVWYTFVNTIPKQSCKTDVKFLFHAFPTTNTYSYALSFDTRCIDFSTLNVGDLLLVRDYLNNKEESYLEIQELQLIGNTIYVRVNNFVGTWRAYEDAIDIYGSIVEAEKFYALNNYSYTDNILLDVTLLETVTETIVYNEAYDQYVGFYDHAPVIYINDGVNILSPNPKNQTQLWRHNAGAYGSFYGSVFASTLELVINDAKGVTKTFDNISYHSEVYSNSPNPINIAQETFSQIRFFTDYQNSDWINIVPGSTAVRRVEREWQLPVGRNAVLKSFGPTPIDIDIFDPFNLDATQQFKDRLRDKYMTIDFKYANTANTRFLLNYLKTFYRFSQR